MALNFSTGLRNAMLDSTGLRTALAAGVINIYSGPQPSSADDPIQGTFLAQVTVDSLPWNPGSPDNGLNLDVPVNGVIAKVAAENWSFKGASDGVAGWFRFVGNAPDDGSASTTLPRIDGSVGTYGADLNLSNTNIVTGAPATIDVFQLTMLENC